MAFQRAQHASAEKQRTVVEGVKIAVEEEHPRRSSFVTFFPPIFPQSFSQMSRESSGTPRQQQAQLFQSQLSPHELAYQESLIHEREAEIQEIESGIHELSEIFRDLGTLVNQQGSMIGTHRCDFLPSIYRSFDRQYRVKHLFRGC